MQETLYKYWKSEIEKAQGVFCEVDEDPENPDRTELTICGHMDMVQVVYRMTEDEKPYEKGLRFIELLKDVPLLLDDHARHMAAEKQIERLKLQVFGLEAQYKGMEAGFKAQTKKLEQVIQAMDSEERYAEVFALPQTIKDLKAVLGRVRAAVM